MNSNQKSLARRKTASEKPKKKKIIPKKNKRKHQVHTRTAEKHQASKFIRNLV